MKTCLTILFCILAFSTACANKPQENPIKSSTTFNVVYENGLAIPFGGSRGKKIYAIWAETADGNFIQNIWICANSIKLPKRKMPSYWYANVKEKATESEIDAVTGATHSINGNKNIDFTIDNISLKDASIRSFYVCFEIDRSWDTNDWFSGSYDQPAILYKALVDFDSSETEFTLKPVGWTAGPMNDISATGYIDGFKLGLLNREMRYITHRKNPDNTFGIINPDSSYSALSMVSSIKVVVNR